MSVFNRTFTERVVFACEQPDIIRLLSDLEFALTPRERRLLQAIVIERLTGDQAARLLGCSPQRVSQMRKRLTRKLDTLARLESLWENAKSKNQKRKDEG